MSGFRVNVLQNSGGCGFWGRFAIGGAWLVWVQPGGAPQHQRL